MKTSLLPKLSLCLAVGWLAVYFSSGLAAPDLADQRSKAQKLQKQGNWKEALQIWKAVLADPAHGGRTAADDFSQANLCLANLNLYAEFDEFVEGVIEAHGDDWRVVARAGDLYYQSQHYGYIIDGEFMRGHHRGGGRYVSAEARDRVRALQLYRAASQKLGEEKARAELGQFYFQYATVLLGYRGHGESWRLQTLTDLSELPDYGEPYYGSRNVGTPVDAEGNPVFYPIPKSWDAAHNDGERWRWLLTQAAESDESRAVDAAYQWANFLQQQFGVQTLQHGGYGSFFMGGGMRDGKDGKEDEAGVFELHTLKENETICRLATGIKRITLPDDFNHVVWFERLADGLGGQPSNQGASDQLARIFENRRQFPKAVEYWRKSIAKHGAGNRSWRKKQVQQIVGNWGHFDGTMVQPAGDEAKIGFVFRNGKNVRLRAYEVDTKRLLADVKKYLESNPRELDHEKYNIGQIGHYLVNESWMKYVGDEAADWRLELEPAKAHWDRRIEIETPLTKTGAYVLKAEMDDGNMSNVIIWLSDTAIVKKPLEGKSFYYVADAITGKPVAKAKVEFFGWRQQRLRKEKGIVLKRYYDILTKKFVEFTDEDGQIFLSAKQMPNGYQWLATATTDTGRHAYLGFNSVWYGQRHDAEYKLAKAFAMTDRPVYRPGQEVNYKVWLRHAQYDQEDVSQFAGATVHVRLHDPKGEKVLDKHFKADEFGGFEVKYALPDAATLGQYSIQVLAYQVGGAAQFRVEEYKKPEFEVVIDAPTEPVMLGEEIEATIKASYLFGAPVSNAKVKYKVLRSSYNERWFPEMPWDWFYGKGYWWSAYDYEWYPGWGRWGCERPWPWWQHHGNTPPEVVAEKEVEIGEDGIVRVKFDTALAKAVHGDVDHRYEISAEVTDESRRTIYGKGSVLVARKPFKVTLWMDRGYYRVGDVAVVSGAARTLDGKAVKGDGKLTLYEVSYDKDFQPVEKAVTSWEIDSGDDGQIKQQIKASKMGQYRVSYQLTDAEGHTIEGAYVFVVRGAGFDGKGFRFNELELVTDKLEYKPGDTVQLMVNTDRAGAAVALFIRPTNGVYLPPQILRFAGKSTVVEIPVSKKDMPNFFVEAVTVHGGKVYSETREIVVPPEKRVLDVAVLPSEAKYKPGEKATVKVKLTDSDGEPYVGSTVVTIYDKALEYISGGSNVGDIREFFWKWRRHHNPRTEHNLAMRFGNIISKGKEGMAVIGAFGNVIQDQTVALSKDGKKLSVLRGAKAKPQAAMAFSDEPQAEESDAFGDAAAAPGAGGGGAGGTAGAGEEVQPTVRSNFADLALWAGALTTAKDGTAEVKLDMPENLTTWKIKTWGMGHGTKVGAGETEVITSKDLLIRMQAPRFFVEKDEVTLSANVHNYLDSAKDVRVVLEIEGTTLTPRTGESKIRVEAGGEQRVDWRVKAVKEGQALITMKAITDEESDAMQMSYPVLVHGMLKTESYSGALRPEDASGKFEIRVPAERRVAQTVLEIRYSPTVAGAMVDALPYLASYPYGCTEQTLSRFLPTVITQKILLNMGIDLADVKAKRSNLNPQEIGDDQGRAGDWLRYKHNPVWDEDELALMVKDGVQRLTAMQNSDGGWGWFSGHRESSYPHTTAYVVHGLQIARENDVALVPGVLENGLKWLERYQAKEIAKIKNWGQKNRPRKQQADNLDAFVFMVLCDEKKADAEMRDFLYRDRNLLALYGKAMFGLALDTIGRDKERDMLIRNIEQFLVTDDENQTAYLRMQNGGYWWYWYGSEYEAQGYYLKLLSRVKPQSKQASGLVKYLINNRKHATYWNSTRDTAVCIEAIADYLKASKEDAPDLTVEVVFDGKVMKEVEIDKKNLFTFDNQLIMRADAVGTGKHTIELRKKGRGPIYYNAYLTNFTLEDRIAKAGLEIKVERKYYKLVPVDKEIKVVGAHGQAVGQKVEKHKRILIEDGDVLKSGDLVEVELIAESKNDYEYILFEDPKAAGFEPVDVRSGYTNNGLGAYVEYRDQKVALFVRALARGKHSLSYRLRAEIPGKFSALPTKAEAMYAPELKANSDELKIGIED